MRQPLTALHRFAIGSLPLVVLCLAGCRDWSAPVAAQESADAQRPPLEIRFLPASGHRARQGEISCKVPAGRDQALRMARRRSTTVRIRNASASAASAPSCHQAVVSPRSMKS